MKRYAGTLAALVCGLALMILCFFWQDPGAISGTRERLRILSNAALVPGVLLTGIGGLVKISDEQFFDGIKYTMHRIASHLRREPGRHASYYEYTHRERRRGNARPLLLAGFFFLILAVILTVLFYV